MFLATVPAPPPRLFYQQAWRNTAASPIEPCCKARHGRTPPRPHLGGSKPTSTETNTRNKHLFEPLAPPRQAKVYRGCFSPVDGTRHRCYPVNRPRETWQFLRPDRAAKHGTADPSPTLILVGWYPLPPKQTPLRRISSAPKLGAQRRCIG